MKKFLNFLSCTAITGVLITTMVFASLYALDRSIYPGCTITSQSGDILTIQLDEDLFDGSDTGCLLSAQLVKQICEDGYRVKVWGRIIDLTEATKLANGDGGYGATNNER